MTLNADLRAELLRRVERDQAARQAMIEQAGAVTAVPRQARQAQTAQAAQAAQALHTAQAVQEVSQAVARIDGENLAWFRTVVAESGWPGRSDVGDDGARAAWLLAQHADRDPAFQRHCLDLLTAAADRGEAARSRVAYLTDRVLLAEGGQQEFGTQTTAREGRWAPVRLRDPDGVDQRRAAMSLRPLAEYLAGIAEHYGPPSPAVLSCPECGGPVEFWPPDPAEQASVGCPGCGFTIEVTTGT